MGHIASIDWRLKKPLVTFHVKHQKRNGVTRMTDIELMINDIDNLITKRIKIGYAILDKHEYGTPNYMFNAGMMDSVYHFAYDVAQFDCTIQDAIDVQWDEYFFVKDEEDAYSQGYALGAMMLIESLKHIEHDYYQVTNSPIRHVFSVCYIETFKYIM